jgi:hypothetical protein
VSNWLAYDDFVDRVRNHHHDGFTGLITGISDSQHSFQIGFRAGQVVLLNYRIFKGAAALEKLIQISRVKISEHPNTDIPATSTVLPETSAILSRLTMESTEDKQNNADLTIPQSAETSSAAPSATAASSAQQPALDIRQMNAIKAAAIHHFGPIGAIVCEEFLSAPNVSNIEITTLLRRIAEAVDADSSDTQAFINSAS